MNEDSLNGCTIISAGLGEDASFDIEFASRYNAKVIMVDPTPRAIIHFELIESSLGSTASQKYSNTGCQPIGSYDLSRIEKNNLVLVPKALWNENTSLDFYEPPNPENVSHSILNIQNYYSKSTKSIKVDAITLEFLLEELSLKVSDIPIMKLDIEGAEIEVLRRCVETGILTRQILVEFDELNFPSSKGLARVTEVDELLRNSGYNILKTDGQSNFLYYKETA